MAVLPRKHQMHPKVPVAAVMQSEGLQTASQPGTIFYTSHVVPFRNGFQALLRLRDVRYWPRQRKEAGVLHIRILAVGQLKERFWKDACAEYLKRLKPYAQVTVLELTDVDPARAGGDAQAIQRESASILQALKPDETVILLDISGKQVSSPDIANALDAFALDGANNLAFVIGGSAGVADAVRQRAQARWSLGRITLPHNLARVVFLEQIYRAFKISRAEPYHK